MTRVTDEQMAEWRDRAGGFEFPHYENLVLEVLGALAIERERADDLESRALDGLAQILMAPNPMLAVGLSEAEERADKAERLVKKLDQHRVGQLETAHGRTDAAEALRDQYALEAIAAGAAAEKAVKEQKSWMRVAVRADGKAARRLERLGKLRANLRGLRRLREIHKRVSHSALYPNDCGYCGVEWPCETVQILDGGVA